MDVGRVSEGAHEVRSTWLTASVAALKRRGHLDRYIELLPPDSRDTMLSMVAGTWLPARLAMEHYGACEALELPPLEIQALGSDVVSFTQRTFVVQLIQAAQDAVATPWLLVDRLPRLFARGWRGSVLEVERPGPSDAVVVMPDWPLARFTYVRLAVNGILDGLASPLAPTVRTQLIAERSGENALAYRITWDKAGPPAT